MRRLMVPLWRHQITCPSCYSLSTNLNRRYCDKHAEPAETDTNPDDFWGSDCEACGNATPGSMTCDECGSDEHTTRLRVDAPGVKK